MNKERNCPTCGAAPDEQCELNSGQPRTQQHRDRARLAAVALNLPENAAEKSHRTDETHRTHHAGNHPTRDRIRQPAGLPTPLGRPRSANVSAARPIRTGPQTKRKAPVAHQYRHLAAY